MRRHQTEQPPPRDGYPYFRIRAGESTYHLRIPSIASASSLAAYYSGVVVASQGAAKLAQQTADADASSLTVEQASAASEALLDAQAEMYGALGFVILSCWRDPLAELVSRSAWLESYAVRKALRDGLPLDGHDEAIVAAVREATRLGAEHRTDLKTAFGLLAWDELVEAGLTHEGIQTIGTECARLVFDSIKSKGGHGVEIIADF